MALKKNENKGDVEFTLSQKQQQLFLLVCIHFYLNDNKGTVSSIIT